MKYICPSHPDKENAITYNNLQNNYGCPYCANNIKLTIDFVKEQFAKDGYEVLDFEYEGNRVPLNVRCPNTGKINSITYHDFQQGSKCSCCRYDKIAEKRKMPIEKIRKAFAERNYELLETEYKNAHTPLKFRCPNHPDVETTMTWMSFRIGSMCKLCYDDSNKGSTCNAWKGGTTEINLFLRSSTNLLTWKIKWLDTTGGKCSLSGIRRKNSIHVHHSKPHYRIRDEVLSELGLPLETNIGVYTDEQREAILAKYIKKHDEIEGIPLLKKWHTLFHNQYGIDASYEDYLEFKNRWESGEFEK